MLIDWHAHHTATEVAEQMAAAGGRAARPDPQDSPDFGQRIGAMDDAGIDMQIVSQGGGLNSDYFDPKVAMELVGVSNDLIAERIAPYRDRLIGSVAVTYKDAEASANEIERMASQGFRAVMLYANGDLATRPESEPIFARAEELGMPMFLHGGGVGTVRPAGVDRLEDEGRGVMSSSGADAPVADCVMQMIASGLFDSYPGLSVVIRSGGGGIPLLQSKMWWTHHAEDGDKQYSEIFRQHFLVDTANVDARTITALRFLMGDDGVVFGSDYGGGLGLLRDAVANIDAQPDPDAVRAATERNSRELLSL
jgi:predicted TIM-barrel fold metal-dependent hydrolase